MQHHDSNRYSARNPVHAENRQSTPNFGIYLGIVKDATDLNKTGKLKVYIPALHKNARLEENFFYCQWTSPFAGATNIEDVGKRVENYEQTQKSYGLWMVPPDIGNTVLVAFIDGDIGRGVIINCMYPENFTNMVPGMPAGLSYGDPGMLTPVAEKNIRSADTRNEPGTLRPLHVDMAEALVKQGLINDPIRGAGTSGSKRESPSEVYGLLTPGPKDPKIPGHRTGGHQFVLDDNVNSRLIRLRTAGGSQLLLDDTTGSIYMITRSGRSWAEMDHFGNMRFYGEGSISMRAGGNFNIRADRDVNIEAGNDINLRAAGDYDSSGYRGPALGVGGAINLNAATDINQFAKLNFLATSEQGDLQLNAAGQLSLTSSSPNQSGAVNVLATSGPVRVQGATDVSLLSGATMAFTSGAPMGIGSPLLLINSGGPTAAPALPALAASTVDPQGQQDQSREAPEFDRDAARRGQPAIKTMGRRPAGPTVKTIVSDLVTAEPYAGHYQFDPVTNPPGSVTENRDPEAMAKMLARAGLPAPTNTATTPQSIADSMRNIYGNTTNAASTITQTLARGASKVISGLRNTVAVVRGFITRLIPPIRFPTVTAAAQRIIGTIRKITDVMAQLMQIATNIQGMIVDLLSGAAAAMRRIISDVIRQATTQATT